MRMVNQGILGNYEKRKTTERGNEMQKVVSQLDLNIYYMILISIIVLIAGYGFQKSMEKRNFIIRIICVIAIVAVIVLVALRT